MSIKLPHMNNALVSLGFDQIADYDLEGDSDGSPQISDWRSSSPQPTQSEIETAHAEWVTAHDAQEYARKRRDAYDAAGCTIDALTIATFESVFADDSSAAVLLQIQREKIRAAIPKVAS